MKKHNFVPSLFLAFFLLFGGCTSELEKIRKDRNLTTECFESLKLVKESLERSPNGITLQLKQEYLAEEEKRKYRIGTMSESFVNNIGDCWSKNFTQADILKLFGRPTREVVNQRSGELSYKYMILNKSCSVENGEMLREFDCGQLRFTFSKDNVVNNGMLYLYD